MFRRVIAAAVLVVVGVVLLVMAWPQLFGLQQSLVVAQIVSLRGLAIACALLGAVILLLLAMLAPTFRRFTASLALMLIAFSLVSGAVLASRGIGHQGFHVKGDSDVTVLSWNTLGDSPSPEVIARLALDTDADIVSLPETTRETALAVAGIMRAAGVGMSSHTFAYDEISKARSTSLLVSDGLGAYTFDANTRTTAQLPTIVASPVNGSGPTIVAVHAVAPIPSHFAKWQSDLELLKGYCSGANVILAGDLNATLDHLSGLGNGDRAALGDCLDAAERTGNGALGTWPTAIPPFLGAPIDHVMATPNWRFTGMRIVESADTYGSDHRPIVVQLSPAG